jgi:rubrerythrin
MDIFEMPSKYALVSWAIEERVLKLYPEYLEKTKLPQVKRALIRILAQEQKHSGFFSDCNFGESTKEKAVEIENRHWNSLANKLLSSL